MSSILHNEDGYYSILREGLNNNNLQTPKNIFDLENKVMKNVDVFQQKYARFLRCSSTQKDIVNNVNPECDPMSDGLNGVDDAYRNVMYSIDELKDGLNRIDKNNGSGMSNAEYKKDKDEMMKGYQELIGLRQQLDVKLADLYKQQKLDRESSATQLDSSVYANTLWTILATCLLYYILVEL
jgi:hypothetical protein